MNNPRSRSKGSGKPLSQADYRLLAEFRQLLRQFLMFSEHAARGVGLAPQHHQALLAIKGFEHSTVGDLAHRLGVRPHSAAELVDRLVAVKLVRRRPDTVDRRRVYLSLTPAAQKKLEILTVAHRAELANVARSWTPLFEQLKPDSED